MKTELLEVELTGTCGPYAERLHNRQVYTCFGFDMSPESYAGTVLESCIHSGCLRVYAYAALANQLLVHVRAGNKLLVTADVLLGRELPGDQPFLLHAVAKDVLLLNSG